MSQPIVLTNGQHEIKIYTVQNRGRSVFQLSYYEGGHRQRKTFGKLSDARRETVVSRLAINAQADELSTADEARHRAQTHRGDRLPLRAARSSPAHTKLGGVRY